MEFSKQVEEVRSFFKLEKLEVINEGGCRFLHLPQTFKTKDGEILDCLFACDDHLGYPNRLWFPRVISTSEPRGWNGQNVYIAGRTWFAFSMRGKGATLLEIILSHYMGAK